MKAVLIVNPFASRVTQAKLAAVQEELARAAELTVVLTERPGHATEIVRSRMRRRLRSGRRLLRRRRLQRGAERSGRGRPDRLPPRRRHERALARARAVRPIRSWPPAELAAAIAREAHAEDHGRASSTGSRFAFGAGIGLDAEAVRRVDRMGRTDEGKRPGDLAFALASCARSPRRRGHMEPVLEVKGFGRAAFALVANGSPYTYAKRLPLPLAPEAQFELGLDVIAPVRVRRRTLVPTALSILAGRGAPPSRHPVRPRPRPRRDRVRPADRAARGRRGPRRRRGGRVRGRARRRVGVRLI